MIYFTLLFCSLLIYFWSIHSAANVIEWVSVPLPDETRSYVSLSFSATDNLVAVGNSFSGGTIARSVDEGVSWTAATCSSCSFGVIYDVSSNTVSSTIYYLAVDENGQVYLSTDSGATWSISATIPWTIINVSLGANGNAFAAGISNRVYTASDSNSFSSWEPVSPTGISPSGIFWDISTLNGDDVIAVGQRGYIYYSSDAGANWSAGTSGVTTIIYCVDHGSSSSVAMAAGASSYVAKTVDGGATWSTMSVYSSGSVTTRFHAIYMHTDSEAYIAGSNGEVYSTDDGGSTWTLEASTGVTLFSIEVLSNLVGAAGAAAGSNVYVIVSGAYHFFLLLFLLTSFSSFCHSSILPFCDRNHATNFL